MNSLLASFNLLPESASNVAQGIDDVTMFILYVSIISFVGVIGAMCWFVYKYRRKTDNDEVSKVTHHFWLEVTWTLIPLILVMFMFWYGFKSYMQLVSPPENCIKIKVTGIQWKWKIDYPGVGTVYNMHDKKTSEKEENKYQQMTIPVNTPILLELDSMDVIHSFGIPAFRVKQDTIKGQPRRLWFTATKEGTFRYYCYENCGEKHALMSGTIRVVSMEEYKEFLKKLGNKHPGEVVYGQCSACHSLEEGKDLIGPSFYKLIGSKSKVDDGEEVTVDYEYLKESILKPDAKWAWVNGKKPLAAMPATFANLKEKEIKDLYDWLKNEAFKDKKEQK